jgi:hypothetical protein
VLEAGAGYSIFSGANLATGIIVNVRTGERCIFGKACYRMAVGAIASAGFKAGAQFLAPRCGKDTGGSSVEAHLEGVAGEGGSGSVGYGGGIGVGVGTGPEVGAGFSLGADFCYTKVIRCWGSPCECK